MTCNSVKWHTHVSHGCERFRNWHRIYTENIETLLYYIYVYIYIPWNTIYIYIYISTLYNINLNLYIYIYIIQYIYIYILQRAALQGFRNCVRLVQHGHPGVAPEASAPRRNRFRPSNRQRPWGKKKPKQKHGTLIVKHNKLPTTWIVIFHVL